MGNSVILLNNIYPFLACLNPWANSLLVSDDQPDHVQMMLLFVYGTTRKRFVIFTCRYFK